MKTALCFCFLLVALQAFADPAIAIKNVNVIDATGSPVQADRTVIFQNGAISEIGPAAKVKIPANAQVVDGAGKYLIPGLWDMHVHTALVANPEWMRKVCLPFFTANGVTGIRDMGGDFDLIRQVRKEIESGAAVGPRIIAAGPMLDGPGEAYPPIIRLESVAAARAAVDSLQEMHADFVKVLSLLPRDVYFAVAAEAKKRAIVFVGHVPQTVSVAEASNAGQKSIEHLDGVLLGCSTQEESLRTEINDAVAKADFGAFAGLRTRMLDSYDADKAKSLFALFAKNGTWQVPTFSFLRTQASLDEAQKLAGDTLKYAPPDLLKQWQDAREKAEPSEADRQVGLRRFQKNLEVVGLMKHAGVGILAGTDTDGETPFLLPGFSLHDELKSLVQAGLTPMEALQSATLKAAQFLGLEKTQGTLEKGKVADAVLLNANPLDDISNTRAISAVILRGKLITHPLDAL